MKENNEHIKLKQEWKHALSQKVRIKKDLEWYRDRSSFVEGDPHQTSFREGQRMMCVVILEMTKEDDDVRLEG